ncbi:MAG: ABC transporter permease [Proteobacteria bacterium]|nr:ABC transporter permease [Pseudomonadota bacterium]
MKRWLTSPALRPVWLLIVLVVAWDVVIRLFKIPPYLIPTPESVIGQLVKEWPMLWRESLPTLYATLGGFVASAVIGVPIAMWISWSRVTESFVYPLLVFSQSVPKVAIAPLFVVWFGFGVLPKIIVAFLLGFFPVIVSTVQGFKSIEPDVIDLARSMGAGPFKVFLKFRLPHAMPAIFAGLKVSVTLAVVGAVVGEFVGSNSGLGYVLQKANGTFDLPLMFAGMVILSMIGVLLFIVIELVERWLLPWHASQRHDLTQATA